MYFNGITVYSLNRKNKGASNGEKRTQYKLN